MPGVAALSGLSEGAVGPLRGLLSECTARPRDKEYGNLRSRPAKGGRDPRKLIPLRFESPEP